MTATTFNQLLKNAQKEVDELQPWDVEEILEAKEEIIILDIREPYEYRNMWIKGAINVPRGVLETACEWGYDETIPELVRSRDKKILVVCRSGNRSLLAAQTMKLMGYKHTYSLKTGLKGWNEYDLPLFNDEGEVDLEAAEAYHIPRVNDDQLGP
ncbi:MAG: rhodanese-like domain-containing protein [Gammaproteobacteria bacterium]|nr:rhodanese-like domain-containing protein [Gammaproteobacteria bacterium]